MSAAGEQRPNNSDGRREAAAYESGLSGGFNSTFRSTGKEM